MSYFHSSKNTLFTILVTCGAIAVISCQKNAGSKSPAPAAPAAAAATPTENVTGEEEAEIAKSGHPCAKPFVFASNVTPCEQLENHFKNYHWIASVNDPTICEGYSTESLDTLTDSQTEHKPDCAGITAAARDVENDSNSADARKEFLRGSNHVTHVTMNSYVEPDHTHVTQTLRKMYTCYSFNNLPLKGYRAHIINAGLLQPLADQWNHGSEVIPVEQIRSHYIEVDNIVACALFDQNAWSNSASPNGTRVVLDPVY